MGSLQRLAPLHPHSSFSGGDLISLLQASSENKTVCARICVCFSACLHLCVRAHTRNPGQADLPHLRSAL